MAASPLGLDAVHTFVSVILLGTFATVAVGLRLWARARAKAALWWDDYFVIAAVVFLWIYYSLDLTIATNQIDFSKPGEISEDEMKSFLTSLYAQVQVIEGCLDTILFSVLCLYWRIFSVKDGFRTAWLTAMGLSVASAIFRCCITLFRCRPVAAAYDPSIDGSCLNVAHVIMINASQSAALDLYIIVLPVSQLRGLNLSLRKKISLMILFAAAGFASLVEIIWVACIYDASDGGIHMGLTNSIWIQIRLALGIICVCVPCFSALFPSAKKLGSFLPSGLRPKSTTNKPTGIVSKSGAPMTRRGHWQRAHSDHSQSGDPIIKTSSNGIERSSADSHSHAKNDIELV